MLGAGCACVQSRPCCNAASLSSTVKYSTAQYCSTQPPSQNWLLANTSTLTVEGDKLPCWVNEVHDDRVVNQVVSVTVTRLVEVNPGGEKGVLGGQGLGFM